MIDPDDWQQLGLDTPTSDLAVVKRAYALRLRTARPDDDAPAYQRLREAYDRVVSALRAGHVPQHAAAPTSPPAPPAARHSAPAVAPVPSPEPAAVPAPIAAPAEETPDAEALRDRLEDLLASEGTAAVLAALPALRVDLARLPLLDRDRAGVTFADWVIARRDLPRPLVEALAAHFDWHHVDYRASRALGLQRTLVLQATLADPSPPPPPVRPAPRVPPRPPLPERTQAHLRGLGHLLAHGHLLRAWLTASLLTAVPSRTAHDPDTLEDLGIDARVQPFVGHYLAFGTMTRLLGLLVLTVLLLDVLTPDVGPRRDSRWGPPIGLASAALLLAWLAEMAVTAFVTLLSPYHQRHRLSPRAWLGGVALLLAAAGGAWFVESSGHVTAMVLPLAVAVGGTLLAMPRLPDDGIAVLLCALYVLVAVPGWPVAPLLLGLAWLMGSARLAGDPLLARCREAWRSGGAVTRLGMAACLAVPAVPLALVTLARRHGLAAVRWALMLATLAHLKLGADVGASGWRLTWMAGLLLAIATLRQVGNRVARWWMPASPTA